MNRDVEILLFAISASVAVLSSCIREQLPACPPLTITVTVKDVNYFNIDDAVKLGMMERTEADLPFRFYVHSLYYIIYDENGSMVAERRNIAVDNDDKAQTITMPASLPYGKYTITVWGNMDNEESLGDGSTEAFDVVKTEGFKRTIVLNRQVAGVYVYANEIPYIAGGTQLRLVSSDENNNLILGQFANADMTDNGTGSGITTAVVNGASSGSEFDNVLATIDLGEWFTTLQDNDGDNLIDTGTAYDNWHKPAKYNGSATFEKGAVFSGEFVIPFAKVDGAQTLKLQLTTSAGEVKREWNVNLPQTDSYTLYTWNGSDFGSGESVTEDSHIYNIVRNHLYGLGTRTANDPGDGIDPEPGGGDDDDPISLNNKHELKLIVNDNWEVIHDMELD